MAIPKSRAHKFAEPVTNGLSAEGGESEFLSVLAPNFEMKYIAKAVGPHVVSYGASLGAVRPPYCMSSGIAVLAWLSEEEINLFLETVNLERKTANTPIDPNTVRALLEGTRKEGYAELRDARVEGASEVSAPIFDDAQQVMAALTPAGLTARFTKSRPMLLERMVEAGPELTARIAIP